MGVKLIIGIVNQKSISNVIDTLSVVDTVNGKFNRYKIRYIPFNSRAELTKAALESTKIYSMVI